MMLGIYCAGGFGGVTLELAYEINEQDKRWDQIVYIDDKEIDEELSVPVESFENFKRRYGPADAEIIIAVGEPSVREIILRNIKLEGYKLPNLIHPSAHAKKIKQLGEGNIILFGAYISYSNVSIGDNNIFMPYSTVSHDCKIGSNSIFATASNISGGCFLGDRTYIGVDASVKEGIKIDSDAIIGMGSIVLNHVDEGSVVAGIPAKEIRKNNSGRVFGSKKS